MSPARQSPATADSCSRSEMARIDGNYYEGWDGNFNATMGFDNTGVNNLAQTYPGMPRWFKVHLNYKF